MGGNKRLMLEICLLALWMAGIWFEFRCNVGAPQHFLNFLPDRKRKPRLRPVLLLVTGMLAGCAMRSAVAAFALFAEIFIQLRYPVRDVIRRPLCGALHVLALFEQVPARFGAQAIPSVKPVRAVFGIPHPTAR